MSRFGSQFKQRKPKMKRIQNISLSLMSLLSECGGHQGTPRTLILALLLLLALTSCQKRPQPSTPEDQKTLIGFSAVSQSAAVKSVASNSLANYHPDFGVWGIARSTGQQDYILWENNALSEVNAVLDESDEPTGAYAPASDAYWLSGFKYNFIAIAPYDSGITGVNFSQANNSARDALSFSYNISEQYQDGDYDNDMMAAVAETSVAKATTHPSQQNLTFWHIFSQINIAVNFKDADGNNTTGTATLRLHNVDQDVAYQITSVDNTPNITSDEVTLQVNCTNTSPTCTVNPIVFNESNNIDDTWRWTLNIVPQNIGNFELYLDYTIAGVTYRDYKINLFPSSNTPKDYGYNQQYNWNITIRPKDVISFNVSVTPWTETPVPDGDDDTDNNEIEII